MQWRKLININPGPNQVLLLHLAMNGVKTVGFAMRYTDKNGFDSIKLAVTHQDLLEREDRCMVMSYPQFKILDGADKIYWCILHEPIE